MRKPRPFRLTAPRILESDRQSQIIDWLRVEQAAGRVSWFARVNSGAVKAGARWIVNYRLYLRGNVNPRSKGYADLHGMLPDGRYFAFEVKQPGEKATPEQLVFIASVIAAGGIADVVYGFEDVEQALKQATKTPLVRGIAPVAAG